MKIKNNFVKQNPFHPNRGRCVALSLLLAGVCASLWFWLPKPENDLAGGAAGEQPGAAAPLAATATLPPGKAGMGVAVSPSTSAPAQQQQHQGQKQSLQALPQTEQQSLWTAFHAARRVVQPLTEYESSLPQNAGVRYFAANPGQKLNARFLDGAVRIESGRGGKWAATLSYAGGQTSPVAKGDRVEFEHPDGVTEWYVNRAEGIEHGFTVSNRPEQAGKTGELRVPVTLAGLSARAVVATDGNAPLQAVEFFDADCDAAVLRYDKLKVNDANGRELPARFAVTGSSVTILVADAGATYPVTIDPLITSQEAQFLPESDPDGATGDWFGYSVALSGDTALIGAYGEDTSAGSAAGSMHVFVNSGGVWRHQAKLTPNDPAAGDYFGFAVALEGNTALVGVHGDDNGAGTDAGSAYVFVRSGSAWSQSAKLLAGDAGAYDYFGYSVGLSGNTAIMGAYGDDTVAGTEAGSAYIFVKSGSVWTQQAKLTANDGGFADYFGYAVALEGEIALAGAYGDDTAAGSEAGSAYVFVRSGAVWSQQTKLTASDAATGDYFGSAVALEGNTVLVGAHGDDTAAGGNAGSAYVFVASGTNWSQQAKITANDGGLADYFGYAVALKGDTAVIGAYGDDTAAGTEAGSAYVYVRNGTNWSQQAKLTASDGATGDYFGFALALEGNTLLVGVHGDDTPAGGGNAGSAYVFVRSGTNWSQQAKLEAGDGASSDSFGYSVALEGNTALLGTPWDDTAAGFYRGTAYVFVRSGTVWNLQKKLTASDAASIGFFGTSVALSGETALVGAGNADNSYFLTGSAYVFIRSGTNWSQQAKLTANDGLDGDHFGNSVALSGNTALVGAYRAGVNDTGAAYVFVRSGTTWSQQTKLTVGDAAANDYFGSSVALEGDTALVGSYNDYTGFAYSGSAFVFVRSGTVWSQQAKLIPSDAAGGDRFGCSVALSGDTALVGAYWDNSPSSDAGSAYIFTRSGTTWSQQAKLTASDAANNDYFGYSVALSGNTALVGAYGDDTAAGSDAGSVYAFVRTGTAWSQAAKQSSSDAAFNDYFGYSVALSSDTALVGVRNDDTPTGYDTGSVYVFRLDFSPDLAVEETGNTLTNGVSIQYGTNEVGFVSVTKTFILRNFGGSNLVLSSFTPSGTSGAHYSFNTNGMTFSILPGSNTSFSVTYAPVSAGTHPHTLSITSNDPDQPVFTINLTGTGVDLDPGLVLYFPPPDVGGVGFGNVLVGTSSSRTLVISNTGPGILAISNLVASAGPVQYLQIDNSYTDTLVGAGGTTSVNFIYTPTNAGTHQLTMDLESNDLGGLEQFLLTGQAFFPEGDADGDGLNDFAELQLAPLGFHWQTNNASLVSILYSNAYTAGLFTQAELQGLAVNSPLLSRSVNGLFKLTIGVQKSTNLINFTLFPMTAPQTSINATGQLEFEFTSPDGAAFYRLEAK